MSTFGRLTSLSPRSLVASGDRLPAMVVANIIVNYGWIRGGEGSGAFMTWKLLACAFQAATAGIQEDESRTILGHPGDSLPFPPQVPKLPDTTDSDS